MHVTHLSWQHSLCVRVSMCVSAWVLTFTTYWGPNSHSKSKVGPFCWASQLVLLWCVWPIGRIWSVFVCRGRDFLDPEPMHRFPLLSKKKNKKNMELKFSYLIVAGSSQFMRDFHLCPARMMGMIWCPFACQSSKKKVLVPLACAGGWWACILWQDSPLSTNTLFVFRQA